MQTTPPSSSSPSSGDPSPMWPQRAPARSLLGNPFDGSTPSQPADQPPVRSSVPRPTRATRPTRPTQLARSTDPDDQLYRWERLSLTQQQAAWQMVEQMRITVTHERTRRRRRVVLLGIAILLVVTLDGVLLYLLTGSLRF